jgi:hypothetical protein
MSSKYSLLALGIGVYLAFAIVSFPASVAHRWFSPEGVALAAVNGTLWRGRAAQGGVQGLAFSNLRWRLKPLPLVLGRLDLTAEADLATGFARSDVLVAGNRVELTELSASTDLQTFRELFTLGDVRGQISLTLDRLELIDGWPVSASGQARIANLAVPPLLPIGGVTRIPLGDYSLQFAPQESPGIIAFVNDDGGPLEVSGSLRLSPDRAYLIDTTIRERADAMPVLVEGIEALAEPPDAEGRRQFRLTGTL